MMYSILRFSKILILSVCFALAVVTLEPIAFGQEKSDGDTKRPVSGKIVQSTDLLHWTRLKGEECRFVQNEKWYEKKGRWDCIWTIVKPEGGYNALIALDRRRWGWYCMDRG